MIDVVWVEGSWVKFIYFYECFINFLARFCLQPLGHRSNHHQLIVAGQFAIISYYFLQYIHNTLLPNTH
ncbi:hypothetical protein BLOT_013272 [Blomia tropicalis]|nr:hypothetical protein BLOT_013272 [Blomia tropicalis]